jgi:hypothetical protein
VPTNPGRQLTGTIGGAFLSYVLVPQEPDVTRLLFKLVVRTSRWAALGLSAGDLIMALRQLLNLKQLFRCFVTGYPGPITRLQDYEGIRGRRYAARRQPSLDQTSLPWRLSRSVINAVDLAGAEFARNAESARPIESSR